MQINFFKKTLSKGKPYERISVNNIIIEKLKNYKYFLNIYTKKYINLLIYPILGKKGGMLS